MTTCAAVSHRTRGKDVTGCGNDVTTCAAVLHRTRGKEVTGCGNDYKGCGNDDGIGCRNDYTGCGDCLQIVNPRGGLCPLDEAVGGVRSMRHLRWLVAWAVVDRAAVDDDFGQDARWRHTLFVEYVEEFELAPR